MEMIKRFLKEEEGVTAIEYGLIAALIAIVIIAGITSIGITLNDKYYNTVASEISKPR